MHGWVCGEISRGIILQVDHNPTCLDLYVAVPPLTREVRIVTPIHIPGLIDVSSQLVSVDICSWEGRGYMEGRL